MRKRIKSLTIAVVALAALALGGSALASAGSTEPVSRMDTGAPVQQGDQTTPDNGATVAKHHARQAAGGSSTASDPAGANDTSSPDPGSAASETSAESTSETAPGDGPGGHADPGGDAQNQYQGPGEG
jgi:hypothetical protein